jgi:hypothetical protein
VFGRPPLRDIKALRFVSGLTRTIRRDALSTIGSYNGTAPEDIRANKPMSRPYDIFKSDADGAMIWIEAANDLESAKTLARNLSRHNEGEFVVLTKWTQQVVAGFKQSTTD